MVYGSCPTVRVKADGPHGFIIINESDFDPAVHTLAVVTPPPPVAAIPPPPPAPPVDPLANLSKDWRKGEAVALRKICEQVTGRTPDNKQQAVEMIEAALLARK